MKIKSATLKLLITFGPVLHIPESGRLIAGLINCINQTEDPTAFKVITALRNIQNLSDQGILINMLMEKFPDITRMEYLVQQKILPTVFSCLPSNLDRSNPLVQKILHRLESPDWQIRQLATRALSTQPLGILLYKALFKMLNDPQYEVRESARISIGELFSTRKDLLSVLNIGLTPFLKILEQSFRYLTYFSPLIAAMLPRVFHIAEYERLLDNLIHLLQDFSCFKEQAVEIFDNLLSCPLILKNPEKLLLLLKEMVKHTIFDEASLQLIYHFAENISGTERANLLMPALFTWLEKAPFKEIRNLLCKALEHLALTHLHPLIKQLGTDLVGNTNPHEKTIPNKNTCIFIVNILIALARHDSPESNRSLNTILNTLKNASAHYNENSLFISTLKIQLTFAPDGKALPALKILQILLSETWIDIRQGGLVRLLIDQLTSTPPASQLAFTILQSMTSYEKTQLISLKNMLINALDTPSIQHPVLQLLQKLPKNLPLLKEQITQFMSRNFTTCKELSVLLSLIWAFDIHPHQAPSTPWHTFFSTQVSVLKDQIQPEVEMEIEPHSHFPY